MSMRICAVHQMAFVVSQLIILIANTHSIFVSVGIDIFASYGDTFLRILEVLEALLADAFVVTGVSNGIRVLASSGDTLMMLIMEVSFFASTISMCISYFQFVGTLNLNTSILSRIELEAVNANALSFGIHLSVFVGTGEIQTIRVGTSVSKSSVANTLPMLVSVGVAILASKR
jgi:hypothetical protein